MVSSGPELDLDFLTKRKDNVEVPQGNRGSTLLRAYAVTIASLLGARF
jgi:hypothetical protein